MSTILKCRLFLGSAILLLTACASNPPERRIIETATVEVTINRESIPGLEDLLDLAERSSPAQAADYLLQAARLLLDEGDAGSATELLQLIDLQTLDPPLQAPVILMQAEILSAYDQQQEVLAMLQPAAFPTLVRLEPNLQISYHQLRAAALQAQGELLGSVLERIQTDRLLDASARQQNHEDIWSALGTLPLEQLRSMAATAINFEVRGWYELALIKKQNTTNPDRQMVELLKWRDGWSRHPAAGALPEELSNIEESGRNRPRQIALLLPLGTNAGQVVRDAFMSAYFGMQEIGGQVPEVRLYDTTNVSDVITLHQQARLEGAEVIIGPLLKAQVDQLQYERNLGVITLALNNLDGVAPASSQLYQFALAPEDEARQIAIKAWNDGHRYVAVLNPEASPANDFYTRKLNSFLEQWRMLGGTVVSTATYRNDYTEVITDLLELDVAEERRSRIRQLVGETILYQPRRRQDIDFIFLVAQSAPARQIVPSLAYLYAGDIPVYATQDVYAGVPRPAEDRDLNGVVFGESPWLLDNSNPETVSLKSLFPLNAAQNLRLQAFGIDAFRLYPRLALLDGSEDYTIPGVTGLLHLGPNRNIQRDLVWTTIRNGLVQPTSD